MDLVLLSNLGFDNYLYFLSSLHNVVLYILWEQETYIVLSSKKFTVLLASMIKYLTKVAFRSLQHHLITFSGTLTVALNSPI